jgi:hypothetical protein
MSVTGAKQTTRIIAKAGAFWLAMALPAAAGLLPPPAYSNGFSMTIRLGRELSEALPSKFGEQLDPQVVSLQTYDLPLVVPVIVTEDNRLLRQVCLSAGFIDLVNHISHAKAIDRLQPGFFEQYVRNLAALCSGDAVVQPPDIVDPRYWTEDVMNDQISYFNQMISIIMAINLSHHYLGHYAKYAPRFGGPNHEPFPINFYLTQGEWDLSVRAATLDALNCALSTEGVRALFEAIDKMPNRPAWTAYIIPQQVDIKALNKQLERYETDYFHGKFK